MRTHTYLSVIKQNTISVIIITAFINSTIETIDRFDKHSGTTLDLTDISDMDEFDAEDQNSDELFSFGRKVKIDLADMSVYPKLFAMN